MVRRLYLVWIATGKKYDLKGGRLRIGRAAVNDIVLPDQLVSSKHAVLHNGTITDSGSTNGTNINDKQLAPHTPVELNEGDTLQLGDTKFVVEASEVEQDAVDDEFGFIDDDDGPPGLIPADEANGLGAANAAPLSREQELERKVEELYTEMHKHKVQSNDWRRKYNQIKRRPGGGQRGMPDREKLELLREIDSLKYQLEYGQEQVQDMMVNQRLVRVQDELHGEIKDLHAQLEAERKLRKALEADAAVAREHLELERKEFNSRINEVREIADKLLSLESVRAKSLGNGADAAGGAAAASGGADQKRHQLQMVEHNSKVVRSIGDLKQQMQILMVAVGACVLALLFLAFVNVADMAPATGGI
eukprot:TRINITY_DN21769_c0_g1_i1.p1 TRINITY_DN21769_c0_g1~~TRINITY_DN21769_c0_g1_i1.p1  ORF type:complete len:371 (+),score=223.40 TRINITY_DN21769_c0_g1_i1:28-1113(+)